MCTCGRPLWRVADEVRPVEITYQILSTKNYEPKLSPLYKHTANKIIYTFRLAVLCSKLPSQQVTSGRWQTYCLVSFNSIGTVFKLLSFKQEGKWTLYILKTVRYLQCLVSRSDAIESNWHKNRSEFEIFFHGQERTRVLQEPAWEFHLGQSWRRKG